MGKQSREYNLDCAQIIHTDWLCGRVSAVGAAVRVEEAAPRVPLALIRSWTANPCLGPCENLPNPIYRFRRRRRLQKVVAS